MPRLLAFALAVAAALPIASSSAAVTGSVTVTNADIAVLVGVEDAARPTFGANAVLARFEVSSGGLYTTGPRTPASATLTVLCLARGTQRASESGCAYWLGGGPVTAGSVLPESATIRGRVPVDRRRGGWIEADIAFTAVGGPYLPPASGGYYPAFRDVAGIEVPTGISASAGAYLHRQAAVTGTIRTDRAAAARVRAVAPYTAVLRSRQVGLHGYASPDLVVRRLAEAAVATLPY
ncbi:MAG TPA: hypothetical protein VGX28_13660 [Frankiaceae bacterium]|jgi:hypothetical protein|nr:hypothetical protein [Frankiaceae bacterium]